MIVLVLSLNFIWNIAFKNQASTNVSNDLKDNIEGSVSKKIENKNSNSVKYFFTFIALWPLIAGIWLINLWLTDYNKAVDTLSWEPYQGRILEKAIKQNIDPTVTGHQLSGRTYYPYVKYEFSYNGKLIEWSRIDYSNTPSSGDKSKSQKVLDSLPGIGEKVTVYFSPVKRQAVLFQGAKDSSYFGIIGGVIFLSIGLIGFKFIYS